MNSPAMPGMPSNLHAMNVNVAGAGLSALDGGMGY